MCLQAATVLVARGRIGIADAPLRIRLRMSTAGKCPSNVSPKCPFSWGDSDPPPDTGFFGLHGSPHHTCSFRPHRTQRGQRCGLLLPMFCDLCVCACLSVVIAELALVTDRHPESRQTDRPCYMCIIRPHLCCGNVGGIWTTGGLPSRGL